MASGNLCWVLKEFTDIQIEENPEEGQDEEGGSAALQLSIMPLPAAMRLKHFHSYFHFEAEPNPMLK